MRAYGFTAFVMSFTAAVCGLVALWEPGMVWAIAVGAGARAVWEVWHDATPTASRTTPLAPDESERTSPMVQEDS